MSRGYNILFCLYHNMACNSASHVDGVTRELAAGGNDCVVAVPNKDAGEGRFGQANYRVVLFDEAERLLREGNLFRDGRPLDVFHGWTPRERLRKFHDRLAAQWAFATVVHLEDNEWQIAKSFLGERGYLLAKHGKFPGAYPDSLTDPVAGQAFLERTAGCTVLIDALAQLVPADKPHACFWPAVDQRIFHPRKANPALRKELRVPDDAIVLVYSGNMHAANFREVRSLYLAVHLLNRAGRAARLIRLGTDTYDFPYGYQDWAGQYAIPLGFVEDRERIAEVLALADVLVQPGRPDPFNDLRFPSKLPEFFAMGKPIVLPRTNIGLVTRHLTDAYVLDNANGPAIAEAVETIVSDPALRERLSEGALGFYNARFSWRASARKLQDFYQAVAPVPALVAAR